MARRPGNKATTENQTYKIDTNFYDFRNFLCHVWSELGLPPPSETQLDIALYLQGGVYLKDGTRANTDKSDYDKNTKYKIVQAWRGLGKTWITATFGCWILYLDPHQKIIIASAAENHALKVIHFIRQLLDKIEELKPLTPIKGCRDSLNQGIDVAPALFKPTVQPSIYCGGIGGSWPGNRANLIIADDIETPKNARSDKTREDLLGQISEFKNILVENGKIIMLGTAQSVDSIYFTDLPDKEGYDIKIWPARIPTAEQLEYELYRNSLGCHIKNLIKAGVPEWTAHDKRWTEEFIASKQLSKTQFLLQFMLDTNLSDALTYPLKLSDLVVMPLDMDRVPDYIVWSNLDYNKLNLPTVGMKGDVYYSPVVVSESYTKYGLKLMCIDPSGKGSDRTAYVILYESNSKLFLMDAGTLTGGYEDQTLVQLVMTASKFKVDGIVVEPNFGGGMFSRLLAPVIHRNYNCRLIESEFSNTRKEHRIIDTLEPVLNQHRLVVNEQVILKDARDTEKHHQLFRQLTRITRVRSGLTHDDAIDALAIGVGYMANHLGASDLFLVSAKEESDYDRLERQLFGIDSKKNPNFLNNNW
jgi:hypothetical protein